MPNQRKREREIESKNMCGGKSKSSEIRGVKWVVLGGFGVDIIGLGI